MATNPVASPARPAGAAFPFPGNLGHSHGGVGRSRPKAALECLELFALRHTSSRVFFNLFYRLKGGVRHESFLYLTPAAGYAGSGRLLFRRGDTGGSSMKLSAKARYAARILIELVRRKDAGPVTATLLSRQTGVSTQFIEQILRPLKQAGLTASIRGALGGHVLLRKPEEVTIGDIIRIMEGGIQLTLCSVADPTTCERYENCLTRKAWSALSKTFEREMDAITLADLLNDGATNDHCLIPDNRRRSAAF